MSAQSSLFDPPAQAHSRTSREAALLIKPSAGTLRGLVLDFITQAGVPGATDEEIQEALSMPSSTERPRRVELWHGGFIRDSGTTRKTRSGREATVWRAVAP